MKRFKCFSCCKLLFTPNAQLRLESRLGLHPNWLSFGIHLLDLGDWTVIYRRLSSEELHCFRMRDDHSNNDRAYSSKGLSFYICCECTFCISSCINMYVANVTEGNMVE